MAKTVSLDLMWDVSVCMCVYEGLSEKVKHLCVTFSLHDTCTSPIIQLQLTTEGKAFITLKLLDMTRKTASERDRCPRALIVSTTDMSNNQRLHRHAIQISSHRHL